MQKSREAGAKKGCVYPLLGAVIGGGTSWRYFWPPETTQSSGGDIVNGVVALVTFGFIVAGVVLGAAIGVIINELK
jgi:hypothetical protein